MHKRFAAKQVRFVATLLLCTVCLAPPVQKILAFPSDIRVPVGEVTEIPVTANPHTEVMTSDAHIVHVRPQDKLNGHDVTVFSEHVGDATISTKLFGIIPWKSVRVHVIPGESVYVGGQSVGIRLHSNGVMVVGYQRLQGQDSPAGLAHIQVGDVIEQINHEQVRSSSDVRRITNEPIRDRGSSLTIIVRRGTEHHTFAVKPLIGQDGVRHLGMYVRDKTSGVGTLTFYDAKHHRFGALGHIISDSDTGLAIQGTGALFHAQITGMVKGTAGQPGEKKGRFTAMDPKVGTIEENTSYGVFGQMPSAPLYEYYTKPLTVALPNQVHTGPATMLTVLHDEKVEAFQVNIENLVRQDKPGTKSMILRVTDPKLLASTGGIVQGMSGSPLIQDGRLIGAVTHVFVSDPTRGYGVYAAWMLQECDKPNLSNNVD